MNIREWALLIFTILAQLAVGMMLVSLIVRTYAAKKFNAEQVSKLTDMPLYAVLPVMVLAMVASLFHLGKVIHIIGAVPNLGTSWMSREVVFAVIFTILIAVFAFLQWRKIGSEGLLMAIGWISSIIGLILLYCMSMTYMLPAQPAMNTIATPVLFFVTSLLLGVLGFATILMATFTKATTNEKPTQEFVGKTLQRIAISAITLLGTEFLVLPFYMGYLSTQGTAALHSLNLMVGTYGIVLAIRLILVFVGAGVLAAYLYRDAAIFGGQKTLATLAYSAFVLVLIGEVLARFLFYATHYRIGV